MNLLTEVLKPIPLVVWGGPALQHCGVRAFIRVGATILINETHHISHIDMKRQGYIFVINECDRDLAASKLLDAGFVSASWSYGTCDPAVLAKLDDKTKQIHENEIPRWKDLDDNSIRFEFPPKYCVIANEPVAFVLSSYVGLPPPPLGSVGAIRGKPEQEATPSQQNETSQEKALLPHAEQSFEKGVTEDSIFTCVDGFLYYPNLRALPESLIRVRIRMPENAFGGWISELEVWAIPSPVGTDHGTRGRSGRNRGRKDQGMVQQENFEIRRWHGPGNYHQEKGTAA